MTDLSETFFVVFDTATHPAYYRDVHEIVALPEGAIIRYEYKRLLFKPNAAAALATLCANPSALPVDTLLMYGQKRRYAQGEPDPGEMLHWKDSTFIPTRSARIVAVALVPAADPLSDVFHFHLQLRGFVDPEAAVVADLVKALEAAGSLPFGVTGEEAAWISLLPDALAPRRGELRSDDQNLWGKLVDTFIIAQTQFENDVFWRVREVRERSQPGRPGPALSLEDRPTNERVHTNRWDGDYVLYEADSYEVFLETHTPDAHGTRIPGGATVAMEPVNDDEGLLKFPAQPLALVPNEVSSSRFSVDSNSTLGTRYCGVRLET